MSLDPYDGGGESIPNTFYRPRESERSIYTEKKRGDESLALFELSDLPEGATVTHVTLIPYRGEKSVVGWKDGRMWLPEGDVAAGESVDDAIARVVAAHTGGTGVTSRHIGHLRVRATTLSKTAAPGSVSYEAVYAVEVTGWSDFPADPAWERRVILQRDLNNLIRTSYVELRREYTDSLDRWLLARLKANLAKDAVSG